MIFKKYTHVERLGNRETQGILNGQCFIFPKIDGTNASVWLEDDKVCAGSRRRKLGISNDNGGFYAWVQEQNNIKDFLIENPTLTIYGEWLIPHSLKTYNDDAWRKFYAFDVYCHENECYLNYYQYEPLLSKFNIDYIKPISVIENPTIEVIEDLIDQNTYLIKEDSGVGEGVVIKNYNHKYYDRQTFAKLISKEYKNKGNRKKERRLIGNNIERHIVETFLTESLVEKTFHKIKTEMGGWSSKYIGRLLGTCYYDLINEEMWNIIKKLNDPTINFKYLKSECNGLTKEYLDVILKKESQL